MARTALRSGGLAGVSSWSVELEWNLWGARWFFGFGLIKGQFFKYRKEKRKEKSLRGRGGVSEGAVGLLEPTWLVSGTATCSPGFLSLRISYEFEKILFNLPNFPQFLAMVH
mgnify:CR=1 FL=1